MAKDYNPSMTMQENLSVLRKVNRWTSEELGARIGVTKQTITHLLQIYEVLERKLHLI